MKVYKADLITILGPTATGKTRLAALLAEKVGGEIISADSRQVYRGMDIGTGKDLKDYRVGDKQIPFHLVDIADPGAEYNVFAFQKDFLTVYRAIRHRNHMPLLCGGTGLYLEAVLNGYRLQEVPEDPVLRRRLNALSDSALTEMLSEYGGLHNTTDLTDRQRTIRAIEIKVHEKNHPVKEKFPAIHAVNFGISFPRKEVRERITRRLQERLENGMVEEVQRLLQSGLKPEQLIFYGLEYRFVTQYVTGQLSYDEMFARLNTAIHQFSKRQMTWFRRMEKKGILIHWIDGSLADEEKLKVCLDILQKASF
jgi:tRNA dimethylallyltransferase